VVVDLALLGLGIALQPFRLSAFILILSTKGGIRKGLGFILGWLACLVLVIAVVVLITGGRPVRYLALALFCLLATSSFAVLELYSVRASAAAGTRLTALRTWLDTYGNQVIIVTCVVLGLWLTGRSIYVLITA
jgi:Sap, sulfolipid-1-addressing protein